MSQPPPDCPYLPSPDRVVSAFEVRALGRNRGPEFYHLALEYAQTLWRTGLPAQSLLLINRALGADLGTGAAVLERWPLPYAAAAWVMRERGEEQFIGNPRRHYQHLATRMVEPRKELRTWRAWACWHLSRLIYPAYPADEKQIAEEGVVEPTLTEIEHHLARLGLAEEVAVFRGAITVARMREGGVGN